MLPSDGMAEAEADRDRIVFVMASEQREFQKSVPAGEGQRTLEEIVRKRDNPWIEVDHGRWIIRDHVLFAELTPAGEERAYLRPDRPRRT